MVKSQEATLTKTFAALADPTRRALLARLDAERAMSVSELAAPFDMSLPAVMKHLDVLSDAGLIKRQKNGRSVTCQLSPEPMAQALGWLEHYQRYWNDKLDRLTAFLEDEEWPTKLPAQIIPLRKRNQASPSKSASKPAPTKSGPHGRTPKK